MREQSTVENTLRDDRQRLKLGLFGINCSGGITMTDAPGVLELSWAETRTIAQLADRVGFDLLVPIARWSGYGGRLDPNGESFEALTWAAALAADTERITIVSTCHAPAIHPVVAAKATSTIDHVSAGRFALNLVMGWFTPELAMFGTEPLEHDTRYRFGAEWLACVERLWTADEPFDHHGEFFTMDGARSWPRPIQQPRPVVINAGNSPAGIEFSAAHADVNFATIFTLDSAKAHVEQIKGRAAEHGRDLDVYTYGTVFLGDTHEDAERRYAEVLEHGDWEAAENFMRFLGLNSESFGDQIQYVRERFVTSGGGYPVIGTAAEVADQLEQLADAGIDGMIFGFPDHRRDLERFAGDVLPRLVAAGVRV